MLIMMSNPDKSSYSGEMKYVDGLWLFVEDIKTYKRLRKRHHSFNVMINMEDDYNIDSILHDGDHNV